MAEQLIPFVNGIQYTGSNGNVIFAALPSSITDLSLISESDGILVLGYENGGPNSLTYEIGDWVTWSNSLGKETEASRIDHYIKRSDLP
jgi:hypothetical protein